MTATDDRPVSPFLREPRYDADRLDLYISAAPQEVQDKVRQYPLTDEQAGYFSALVEHGDDNFVWKNNSTSTRLVEALEKKGLAIRGSYTDRWGNVRAEFRPLPGVRSAYVARKAATDRAYAERRAAEEAAREAKVAAARAALNADVATLTLALDVLMQGDVLRDQVHVDPVAVASARARLAGMAETSDFFLGG